MRDFFPDETLVTESLIVDSKVEELVEVEVVFHQKSDITRLELHHVVAEDLRVGPHVHVEGSRSVSLPSLVPLEAAYTDLEGVHAIAIVPQLLVAIFCLVKAVGLVLESDGKATKLCVHADEIR